jgi:probable phosphoglycerate mutase
MARKLIVEADGASRGNPGPASYGALVADGATGEVLVELAEPIGIETNNVAEYRGLIAGLLAAAAIDPDAEVEVRMDSKLAVQQMSGVWQIKHPGILALVVRARVAFPAPAQVSYTWVPREQNKRADALGNLALDDPAAAEAKLAAAAEVAAKAAGARPGGGPTTTGPVAAAEWTGALFSAPAPAGTVSKGGALASGPTAGASLFSAPTRDVTTSRTGGSAAPGAGSALFSAPGPQTPSQSAGTAPGGTPGRGAALFSAGKKPPFDTVPAKPSTAARSSSAPLSPAATSGSPTTTGWGAPDLGPPTTFILLRHGATPLTAEKRFSGAGDPELAETGRAQVAAVARRLAARGGIDAVVSSPSLRTRQTAQAAADALGLPVVVEDDFRETDFGAWDGHSFGEVRERWPAELAAWLGSPSAAPPGGESFETVARRVGAARDRTLERHARQTVLVVSHVTPIKTLVREALGAPPEALFAMELSAAALSVVVYFADGRSSLRLFNDTSHLPQPVPQ